MKVIISAGGTGGHIYPAIAIINKLKEKEKKLDILYIGTTDRMEKDLIPNLGINYVGIEMSGLSKNPIKCFKTFIKLLKSNAKCKKIIKDFKPDVVIGVGGYVTVPVIYNASRLGIPTLLHEQNSIPGKANKFLSKHASVVCVSMESSMKYFDNENIVFTGNLTRMSQTQNVVDMFNRCFGTNIIVPENAQYSTVIGAAMSYFEK